MTAPPPLVSILIPTFDQEGFIGKAIESALAQDYPRLEVVVSDDASRDGTGRAALACAGDPRLRYFRNERNLGRVGNYRRALVDYAAGDWALVLDGDDQLLDPGFVSRAWAAIERHKPQPIVMAQAGHRVRWPDGSRPDFDVLPAIEAEEMAMDGGSYVRFVLATTFFTHLGALYDRRAALRTGFYAADISSTDMDSLLRLALEGDVLLLRTIAGAWNQHGRNASSSLPVERFEENLTIFAPIARRAVERGLASRESLEGPLRHYVRTALLSFFENAIASGRARPFDAPRVVAIAARVDPGLLLDRTFMSRCLRLGYEVARDRASRVLAGWNGRT